MKKGITAIVILAIAIWFYCYWFVAFGTYKIYGYTGSDSAEMSPGYVSAGLYENDFPYRLGFIYMLSRDLTPPRKMIIENVVLTGCESGNTIALGSRSAETEYNVAVVSFDVKKKKGMIYEPYDVEALVILVFEDGSKKSLKAEYHIATNYKERDKLPRWYSLWM